MPKTPQKKLLLSELLRAGVEYINFGDEFSILFKNGAEMHYRTYEGGTNLTPWTETEFFLYLDGEAHALIDDVEESVKAKNPRFLQGIAGLSVFAKSKYGKPHLATVEPSYKEYPRTA